MTSENKRSIRSYVLRQGRMTPSQKQSMAELYPKYGLTLQSTHYNFSEIFNRDASHPTVVEIGFGMGESLAQMAQAQPETNFIGIEVHQPGVGRLMHQIKELGLTNLRVFNEDAVKIIEQCIADENLAGVQIYFPDPWHKKKHNKRRIIQSDFISLITQKLHLGGFIHAATDWAPYAEYMVEVFDAAANLTNAQGTALYESQRAARPDTKFENRGKRLGHDIADLIYKKDA